MSPIASPLPAGWIKILDEINLRLDEAITSTNARMAQTLSLEATGVAAGRQQDITRWQERLRRLSAFAESAEQVVQSVDEILHGEEARLRIQLATSLTLRQKLADGTGGAIGYTP